MHTQPHKKKHAAYNVCLYSYIYRPYEYYVGKVRNVVIKTVNIFVIHEGVLYIINIRMLYILL